MKRNKKKLKEKIYRVIAVYLVLNLLAEIVVPTAAYALTGGPSQAEFESFEPAGTTEMVNPFTGDFNYNIPLMTVPGPNGGYPINLAYHAGIGMEQEASWVGLGWNINAGEITRGMRGLPDDFKGDEVEKTLSMRPNWNLSAKYTYSAQQMNEIFGLSFRRAAPSHTGILYWDSYRGVGVSYSLGLSSSSNSLNTSHMSKSLTLSFGSDEGIGVVPNLSYYDQKNSKDKKYLGLSASVGINSRQGVYGLSLGASRVVEKTGFNPRQTMGVSFARNSYVPNSDPEMIGGNVNLGIEVGEVTTTETYVPFFTIPIPASSEKVLTQGFSASYSNRHYKNTTNNYNAYGYFYEEESDNGSSNTFLKDFNREKDVAVNRHSPALPLAVSTYDSYSIKGQGIGGAFRPFRSDVGLYTDPTTESVMDGGELIVELGKNSTADKYHIGFDASYNHSRSYSGQWENTNHWQEIAGLKHLGKSDVSSDALYEPAYFKTTGEMTASPTSEMLQLQGDQAVRFKLNTVFEDGPLGNVAIKPRIADDELILGAYATQSNYYPMSSYTHRTSRQKRVQNISHRTHEQIADYTNYSSRPKHLYLDGKYPGAAPSGGDNYAYDYTTNPDAHIGEISVVNPDGNRYFYGIPAYNGTQSDAVFSIDGLDYDNGLTLGDFPATQAYSTNDLDPAQNDNGYDHFISKTTLPKYAHSYLLTAIVSPDYVDVDGNGPSEKDLGYYVKFNYYKQSSTYNWRVPYCGANYMKNDISNELDDKASYSYGQKEIYYLNSIETKTHVARFILNDATTEVRQDGYGASSENATSLTPTVSTSQAQRYLKEIKLYSKNDYTKVLKTVALVYDYSLCSGTLPNNYGASAYDPHEPATEINVAKGKGKLTLKKLYITYLGSDKGSLSPYLFDYASDPNYNINQNDRWGTYHADPTSQFQYLSIENPYTDQRADYNGNGTVNSTDETDRNNDAAAWCLSKITLPSGADISINYEADDYAFVQDKKAMQMCRIVGTSDPTGANPNLFTSIGKSLSKKHTRIFFELDEPLATNDASKVLPYIQNLDTLYFKTFMRLKKQFNSTTVDAYDYVPGYCLVDHTSYGLAEASTDGKYHYGYFQVQAVDLDNTNLPGIDVHPFRKAGFQYLRLRRPDLFQSQSNTSVTLGNLAGIFNNLINEVGRIFGFYNFCLSRGFCNELDLNTTSQARACDYKPSYARLNVPDGRKYGGGHRVSKISIDDNWDVISGETASEYGTEYDYVLPDGTSSGVCSYEPLVGGDEIPHRLPVKYSNPVNLFNDEELYIEEPFGEDYFPGAGVGYSRVVVKNVDPSGVTATKTRTGISVTEFYTAKDFPVIRKKTDIQKTAFALPIQVPFVGPISFNNRGYSQGYCIELNDMHGRLKSQAVYHSAANLASPGTQPVSKTEYVYQTDSPYSPNFPAHLNSEVTVLEGDGATATADLGKTNDFFVDMREHMNRTWGVGLQNNIEASTSPAYAIPTWIPSLEYSHAMFRSVVAMKVIYRSGVLSEVRSYSDGAMSTAKNLMYDAETGAPLLTQVTNNFDKPVYTYNYAAHWNYDRMNGAYKNTGATFTSATTNASGEFLVANASTYFTPGDEVEHLVGGTRTLYWVNSIGGGNDRVTLVEEDGDPAASLSSGTLTIIRSGYRNQQVATNGVIVSLSNPVTDRYFPLFDDNITGGWNAYFASHAFDSVGTTSVTDLFKDCVTGEMKDVDFTWNAGSNSLNITMSGQGCETNIIFPAGHGITSAGVLDEYDFFYLGSGKVKAVNRATPTTFYICTWQDNGCFQSCLDNVLHADATRLLDSWTFDYADAEISSTDITALNDYNDWRAGRKGVFRTRSNYLYQVDRKQDATSGSKTDIAKDGTYKHFVLYDWKIDSTKNKQWSFVSRATKYSPYGYALESQDALGIKAASLYGYGSTKQTAASSNTSYFELAFDGFEDYGGGSYPSSNGHGHLLFTGTSEPAFGPGHTGSESMTVTSSNPMSYTAVVGQTPTQYFMPKQNQDYYFSVWVNDVVGAAAASVDITTPAGTTTFIPDEKRSRIDGWRRIEGKFTAPSNTSNWTITLKAGASSTAYFDDIRIQPFKSAMVSYVYDPVKHWLLAELDNRNYATIYNYDEEGAVVQVKKETEKGITTISTSRSNIKR